MEAPAANGADEPPERRKPPSARRRARAAAGARLSSSLQDRGSGIGIAATGGRLSVSFSDGKGLGIPLCFQPASAPPLCSRGRQSGRPSTEVCRRTDPTARRCAAGLEAMPTSPSQRGSTVRSSRAGRRLFLLLATVLAGGVHIKDIAASWDAVAPSNASAASVAAASSSSLLNQAIDACKSAKKRYGEYPSAYRSLVPTRSSRWYRQLKKKSERSEPVGYLQMLNDKLGGYLYATKLGVRTPRILFCGQAKDLPRNMASLGSKYVVKPLRGHSARGVKVVKDGVDMLSNFKVGYNAIVIEYGPEAATVVEELVESAHPHFEGRVPPDYKYHVFEGNPEIMFLVNRDKGSKCKDYFDVTARSHWKYLEDFRDLWSSPCPPRETGPRHYLDPSRKAAMDDAVRTLASSIGRDWMRIDMYDGKRGPVFGEFTPFSSGGMSGPLDSCVMTYLFVAHAERGEATDDAETVRKAENIDEVKARLGLNDAVLPKEEHRGERSNVGFSPAEVDKWSEYDELTKCKVVMEAQKELSGT